MCFLRFSPLHHLPIQLAVKVVCAPAQVQLRDILDSGRLRGRQGLPWGVGRLPSDGVATNESGVRTYHVRFCGWDDRWNEDIKELHCFGSRTFDPDLDVAKWVVSRNPSGKMVVVRSDEAKERGGEPVSDVTAYLADPKRQFLGFRSG